MSNLWLPLLSFLLILALIPAVLWLLKRGPLGAGSAPGVMRTVAVLPLGPGQRLVTVEVGSGEQRRWLVLAVTAQRISTLHAMPAGEVAGAPSPAPGLPALPASFAQVLRRFDARRGSSAGGERS